MKTDDAKLLYEKLSAMVTTPRKSKFLALKQNALVRLTVPDLHSQRVGMFSTQDLAENVTLKKMKAKEYLQTYVFGEDGQLEAKWAFYCRPVGVGTTNNSVEAFHNVLKVGSMTLLFLPRC